MTRLLLTLSLAALGLAVGLWTAVICSYNHQRAANLSDLQRELEIQRAANDQAEARAAVHVRGRSPLPPDGPGDPAERAQAGEHGVSPGGWRP